MELHFVQSAYKKRLAKTFTKEGVTPYPMVKKVNTQRRIVDSLDDYYNAVRDYASCGWQLQKGAFAHDLQMASRAQQIDRTAETETLVIDIDGIQLPDFAYLGKWDKAKLIELSERIIALLPAPFHTVSYVAVASSSCGIKNDTRVHLHFLQDESISPKRQKAYLRLLNLLIPEFKASLSLNGTGKALKYTIDPCLADNTRGIYIAPPMFDGIDNPFENDLDRIALVKKDIERLPIALLTKNLQSLNSVQEMELVYVRDLHRRAGTRYRAPRLSKIHTRDGVLDVMTNPENGVLRLAYHTEVFAYYNIERDDGTMGDSCAYYCYINNPKVMFNFKGEPPFLFEKMDKDAHQQHLDTFRHLSEATEELVAHVHQIGDQFCCTVHNTVENRIEHQELVNKKDTAANFLQAYDRDMPDLLPLARLVFNPNQSQPYHKCGRRTDINTFNPTPLMRDESPLPIDNIKYTYPVPDDIHTPHLPHEIISVWCPTIYKIISHMLNNDEECINHFLNWLAWVWQNRRKPETCWLIQGTQGTGKGVFFNRILTPLWGKYATSKRLENIEDNFDSWIEESLIVLIEELDMNNRQNNKVVEKLKTWITDAATPIRGMRTMQRNVQTYFGVIMFSNHTGAVVIDNNDRRHNVAPRQNLPLKAAYPEFQWQREETDALLEAELPDFALLLTHFECNQIAVFEALENEAKREVSLANKTPAEKFTDAVKNGDLDYMCELLYYRREANAEDNLRLDSAKNVVKMWLRWADENCGRTNEECFIPNDDLRLVMSAFEMTNISPHRFGRTMRSKGVSECRKQNKRGVSVQWQMTSEQLMVAKAQLTTREEAELPVPPPTHH